MAGRVFSTRARILAVAIAATGAAGSLGLGAVTTPGGFMVAAAEPPAPTVTRALPDAEPVPLLSADAATDPILPAVDRIAPVAAAADRPQTADASARTAKHARPADEPSVAAWGRARHAKPRHAAVVPASDPAVPGRGSDRPAPVPVSAATVATPATPAEAPATDTTTKPTTVVTAAPPAAAPAAAATDSGGADLVEPVTVDPADPDAGGAPSE